MGEDGWNAKKHLSVSLSLSVSHSLQPLLNFHPPPKKTTPKPKQNFMYIKCFCFTVCVCRCFWIYCCGKQFCCWVVFIFLNLSLFVTVWKNKKQKSARYGIIVNMKGCVKGPASFWRPHPKTRLILFPFFFLATAVSHAFDDTQSSRNAMCRRNTSIGQ